MSDNDSESWSGIFDELEVKSVPIEYLIEILIHLNDGRTIVFDVDHQEFQNFEELEEDLDLLLEQYDELIDSIDFRVDTDKVKEDITKITRSFMKRAK